MINKKTFLSSLVIGIGAISLVTSNAQAKGEKNDKMEPCYGIVKAGKNDCSDKAGKHSCAGDATENASKNEWILLPKGSCEKIVGGNLK